MKPWLAQSSVQRPGWPHTCGNPLASTSQVLRFQACATMPALTYFMMLNIIAQNPEKPSGADSGYMFGYFKVLFGRERVLVLEFKRLSLVVPYCSKLLIVIVVIGGEGLESSLGPLHANHMLYPLTHSMEVHTTELHCWPFSFSVQCWGSNSCMLIVHFQWPTHSPLTLLVLQPHPVLSFLVLRSKLRVSRLFCQISTLPLAYVPRPLTLCSVTVAQ